MVREVRLDRSQLRRLKTGLGQLRSDGDAMVRRVSQAVSEERRWIADQVSTARREVEAARAELRRAEALARTGDNAAAIGAARARLKRAEDRLRRCSEARQ